MTGQSNSITTLDRFLYKASSDLDGRIDSMEKKIREEKMKLAAVTSSLKSLDVVINQPLDSDILIVSDDILTITHQHDNATGLPSILPPQESSVEAVP